MSSFHLLDPELLLILDIPVVESMTDETLAADRSATQTMLSNFPVPDEPRVIWAEARIPGSAGTPDVRVLICRPNAPHGLVAGVLHIHGGGFVLGTADMNRAADQAMVAELGVVVVSVDYRLAPETPHPGPVEDCYVALEWFHFHASDYGVDPNHIGVSGESAGGGLAAALALLARDRGSLPVAFQHLIYPMLDDRTAICDNPHPYSGEFVWTAKNNRFGWQSLLGTTPIGGPEVSAYAAPARAINLAGLPPTYIAVGALDLFVEENLEYVRRLTRAGVAVEFHLYSGAPHAFQWAAEAAVTRSAQRDSLRALRRFTRIEA